MYNLERDGVRKQSVSLEEETPTGAPNVYMRKAAEVLPNETGMRDSATHS